MSKRIDPRSKRNYWLKLDKDFFDKHYIKIIEAQQNGKEYVLFYLKLLAESVSRDGYLRINENIPYDVATFSFITNTNIDIVRSAIKLFVELGIVEILDDHTFYMTELNKMVGFETEHARQKRLLREKKKKALLESRDNVSQMSLKCLIDKDIDIELDKDIDVKKEKEIKRKKEITSIETTENNEIVDNNAKKSDIVKEIISYLNYVSGKNYRPNTEKTQRHINARLNEGFTLDDFKKVIDIKVIEWKDTEMELYIRPETLFGNKFESYLQQKIIPNRKEQQENKQNQLNEKLQNFMKGE